MFDTCVSISQQLLFRIVMKMLSQGHKIVKHTKKCDIKALIVLQKKIHSFEDHIKMRQIWVGRAKCASLVGGGKIPHNCSSEVKISVFIKNLNQGKLQINNYEIVVNFFHISHNFTWYSEIVHKFTRIYQVCSTYELKKQFM